MPRADQIVTVLLFLTVLAGFWLMARRARPAAGAGRLRVVEMRILSPQDRAALIEAEGRVFLVLTSKGAAPVVTALPAEVPPGADPARLTLQVAKP